MLHQLCLQLLFLVPPIAAETGLQIASTQLRVIDSPYIHTFWSYSMRISWQKSCFIASASDRAFSFSDSISSTFLFSSYTGIKEEGKNTRTC